MKGILLREKDNFRLAIRSINDIDFTEERCAEIITEFTSNQIFISELADPNNNSKARFVELYNSASEPLLLNGWKLLRYTNDNIEVSSTIDLSGFTIEGESTLIISPNAMEFEKVYGFQPDMAVGVNSPADSNGDDNLQLVDPLGTVIDVFGVVGEDGSNTNHEFEDGRAVRNVKVKEANPIYTFDEWRIFNDTGGQGTTKETKNAPEDFTPGIRN
ncbi:lamin tail domain-containing protein [Maribacter sp. 2308TA10-17]|uniref:lamin tail domain-containing protein n=1 Tax=Maribacter sp. 2308TA10-17 TaxID=3386276 RepID=UPI0039BD45BD